MMFLIFIIFVTTLFANSHGKYIDLLPDEEKQEFLEKVARRIMETVESKETENKFSRELSDEQLREHNAYVQSILKQESELMRRSKDNVAKSKLNKTSEESLKVEPLKVKPLKVDNDKYTTTSNKPDISDDEHIDLTVRGVKRRSYDAASPEIIINNTKVETTTEDGVPLQKRSVGTEGISEEAEKDQINKKSKEEGMLTEAPKHGEESVQGSIEQSLSPKPEINDPQIKFQDLTIEDSNNTQSTTDEVDKKLEVSTDATLNNEKSLEKDSIHEESTTENSLTSTSKKSLHISENLEKTNPTEATHSNRAHTEVTTENTAQTQMKDFEVDMPEHKSAEENVTDVTPNSKENLEKIKTSVEAKDINTNKTSDELNRDKSLESDSNSQLKVYDSTLTSTLSDEGTTDADEETTTYITTIDPDKISSTDSLKFDEVTESTSEVNIATTESYPAETANILEDIKTSTLTTTTLSGLTKHTEKVVTRKPKKSKKIFKGKDPRKSRLLLVKLNKVKNKITIRKQKKKDDDENTIFKKIQKEFYENTVGKDTKCGGKPCEYKVFEIPENEPPFLRNSEPVANQPFYIPVYNYSPNNAYFNAQNRLGPNPVEENTIELDAESLRGGKSDDARNGETEFILDIDEMRKFVKYTKRPREYKPANQQSSTLENGLLLSHNGNNNDVYYTPSPGPPEKANTQLPNSDEALHPANGMKHGLKSHLSALRNVLFQKKLYVLHDEKDYNEYLYGPTTTTIEPPKKDSNKKTLRTNDFDLISGKSGKKNKVRELTNSKTHANALLTLLNNHFTMSKSSKKSKKIRESRRIKHEKNLARLKKQHQNSVNKRATMVAVNTSNKLEALHTNDNKISLYMKVLKNLILEDSPALKQYDWLSTTVQIQSAVSKLLELIKRVRQDMAVHPADIQILKYVVFIHNFSMEIRQAHMYRDMLRKQLILPRNRNKNKKNHKILKEKGLLNRVWLYLRTLLPDLTHSDGLSDLNQFLLDIEDGLYDLHEALRNIAIITKYKHQNWYQNLKQLYLTVDPKHLRELLLHITLSSLVDMVEYSCRNGLEDDFIEFMKTHKDLAKKTIEGTSLVIKIVNEINKHSE